MAQNNLSVGIQLLDDSGENLARRNFVVSETDPDAGELRSGILIDTSEATISLPFATIRQVVFRNTHATAKITVKWTPNGGAEATINKIGPGGCVALWDDTAVGTGIGITSLKLTSDTSNATYELTLGG